MIFSRWPPPCNWEKNTNWIWTLWYSKRLIYNLWVKNKTKHLEMNFFFSFLMACLRMRKIFLLPPPTLRKCFLLRTFLFARTPPPLVRHFSLPNFFFEDFPYKPFATTNKIFFDDRKNNYLSQNNTDMEESSLKELNEKARKQKLQVSLCVMHSVMWSTFRNYIYFPHQIQKSVGGILHAPQRSFLLKPKQWALKPDMQQSKANFCPLWLPYLPISAKSQFFSCKLFISVPAG